MSIQRASKNEVRKEIADLINRIKEQSDRIGMQREIPQTELDLILHRIEELHRRTVVWSYLNELPEEVPGAQFSVPGSEITTPNTVIAEASVVVESPVVQKAEPEVIKQAEPEVIKSVQPEKVVVPPVVTENREQRTESITGQPTAKTNIKDVRSFIGFNEKIMYIRQVFKGDDAAYNAALDQFNSMNSWDEAQAFLSVLAGEYKWVSHSEPVEIFTQTVKRRFN